MRLSAATLSTLKRILASAKSQTFIMFIHSRPQNRAIYGADGAWPFSIPPKEPLRLIARVGSIIMLGIMQVTILDSLKIFNVAADILLAGVVIGSLVFEFRKALAFGICLGLFKDAFSISAFGQNTLLFALWSFLIFRLSRIIPIDIYPLRLALICIVAFLHNLISGLIVLSLGNFIPTGIFLRTLFIASLYTAFVFAVLIRLAPVKND